MGILDRVIKFYEEAVSIVSLATIVVLVLVQVFYRYVLSRGLLGVDEIVINLMVLLVMTGSALATRNAMHTDLRMILNATPKKVSLVLRIIVVAVTVSFLVALIYASAIYAYDNRRFATTMMKFPLWLVYGIIPFSAALMLYELLKRVVASVRQGQFNTDMST